MAVKVDIADGLGAQMLITTSGPDEGGGTFIPIDR
jgi:hypothetical protein